MTGSTSSAGYPTIAGAYDTTHNSGDDVFVTKLNAAGSALVYSTFIGGSSNDFGNGIAIDAIGNAYLTGSTFDADTDYPTTAGAFDTTHNGNFDAFATKLNSSGANLTYSTFIGGSGNDTGSGIAIDATGIAYLTGDTLSADYPVNSDAFDTSYNGGGDVFVTKLKATGSALLYSTFVGGSGDDRGVGIANDATGNVYLIGTTISGTDYPTTGGAFDTTYNGGFDVFVSKFGIQSKFIDFDGDGKTDISIFRPAPGEWWINRSSTGTTFATQFGQTSDKIVPADYTGDGKTDVAFWRPSTGQWFVLRSEDFTFFAFPFGANGDVPVPADYDGDGKADATVFRSIGATWFISKSSGGTTIQGFGSPTDAPVPADYDGDGKADLAIYRANGGNQEWWYQKSSNNTVAALVFGITGDKAVQGDYTGDGKTDIAVWRPSNGNWFILRSEDLTFFAFPFGTNGDIPAPGDYDGDGKTDAAVFRPSAATWFLNRSTAGTQIVGFGLSTDRPLPNAFIP